MHEQLLGNPEAPLRGVLTEPGKFCPRNFEWWALTERALGGARDVGFHCRGGAQRTGDATDKNTGVGEGGCRVASVGYTDRHVPAMGDAPGPETVCGSIFKMGQAKRETN